MGSPRRSWCFWSCHVRVASDLSPGSATTSRVGCLARPLTRDGPSGSLPQSFSALPSERAMQPKPFFSSSAIILTLALLFLTMPAWAISWKPIPVPREAKQVQCVGTAVRKVCVGDEEADARFLWGEPVAEWRDKQRYVHEVYEFNFGRGGCWLDYVGPGLRIGTMRCVGLGACRNNSGDCEQRGYSLTCGARSVTRPLAASPPGTT